MSDVDVLDSPQAGATAIRGVLVRVLFFGGGLLVSLAATPFMVRHLGPVAYGYFVSVSAIVFIIAGVTEGGLTNLGIRHYAAGTEAPGTIVGNLVGVRLLLTTSALALAAAVSALAGAAQEIVLGILIYGSGLLLTMISATYAVPLQATLRLGIASGLEFLRQVLFAAGAIALVIAGAGLYAFFGLWALGCFIVLVVTVAIVSREVSIRPAFDWAIWRRYFGEAFAYGVAAAAGLVYFRMSASLMTFLSTDLETGYFALAFRVLEIAANIPALLIVSVFPILARAAGRDHGRLRYAAQRVYEAGLLVCAGMALVLIVGAQPVIELVGGAGFEPAVPVLRLQAAVLGGTVIVATWSLLLLALDEQRALLAVNGVGVAISLLAALVLIPAHGARGGAYVALIAEALVATLSVLVLRRRHPDVAPSLTAAWRVVVALAAGACALLLPAGPVVQMIGAGVLYAVAAIVTRAVPAELWHALRPGARG